MSRKKRETLILQYLSALDNADADTLSAILKQAERDTILSQMITDVHTEYETESPVADPIPYTDHTILKPTFSTNGAHHIKQKTPSTAHRMTKTAFRGYPLMAIVAVLTLVLFGVVVFSRESTSTGLTPQAFSLDGLQPITADNISNLRRLQVLGYGAIRDVVWSPDGNTIAVATTRGIYLHSASDLALEPTLLGGQTADSASIAYTPDSTMIAGTINNRAVLWSATTGEIIREFEVNDALGVSKVMIKPDGTSIATVVCMERNENRACDPYEMVIWDINTGDLLTSFPITSTYFPVFNSDWSLLADAGEEWGDINIYEVETGDLMTTISSETITFSVFDFSPDGEDFFVIGWNDSISHVMIWSLDALLATDDVDTLEPTATIRAGNLLLQQVIFEASGASVFTMGYNAVYRWDFNAETVTTLIENTNTSSLSQIRANPNGGQILVISGSGVLQIYAIESGELVSQATDYGSWYQNVDFTNDTVTATHGYFAPGVARLWDLDIDPITEQVITGYEDSLVIYDLALSPDESEIAYLGYTNNGQRISIRDITTGEDTQYTYGANGSLLYLEDGTLLNFSRITYGTANRSRIFRISPETNELTEIPVLDAFDWDNDHPSTLSSDGRLLIAEVCLIEGYSEGSVQAMNNGCANRQIQAFDVETGYLLATLGDGSRIYSGSRLVFDDDGQTLVLSQCVNEMEEFTPFRGNCEEYELLVWDMSEVYTLLEQETVATDTDDETTEIPFIEPTHRIELPSNDYTFQSLHAPLLLTSESGTLVVASDDELTFIWQLADDGETELIHTIDTVAYGIATNDDGTLLALGNNGTVELWGISQ